MLAQGRLDLTQLDALAPQLNLIVDSTEEFDGAVCPVTGPISSAVKTRPGLTPIGIRNESVGRQIRPLPVAAPYSHAADVKFARRSYPNRLQLIIKDV